MIMSILRVCEEISTSGYQLMLSGHRDYTVLAESGSDLKAGIAGLWAP
jgi:hypothetical protein